MNVIDEWLKSESAKRDALKFKNACDSMDSLRYCAFIQGRNCGKTALARQLAWLQLNSIYGLACSDNDWMQKRRELTDKVYDTLGIKEYLNKVYGDPMLKFKNGEYLEWAPSGSKSLKELAKEYGCDCNLTIDWFENVIKEEETNNMMENGYSKSNHWCFGFQDYTGTLYRIEIVWMFYSKAAYHVTVYRSAETEWKVNTYLNYKTWAQLATQLMCDLYVCDIHLRRSDVDGITTELEKAGRHFIKRDHREKDEIKAVALPFEVMPKIEKVIFNPPATIVQWKDGTKTVVKCQEGDEFDWEKGLAMAYVKRAFNNERTYYGLFKKNEPDVILPKVVKEVRIIVPKDLPVTGDIINKAYDLIKKECDKKAENGIELDC